MPNASSPCSRSDLPPAACSTDPVPSSLTAAAAAAAALPLSLSPLGRRLLREAAAALSAAGWGGHTVHYFRGFVEPAAGSMGGGGTFLSSARALIGGGGVSDPGNWRFGQIKINSLSKVTRAIFRG